jgi:hypothetical protein
MSPLLPYAFTVCIGIISPYVNKINVIKSNKQTTAPGEWRKLNNEGLNDLYSSPYIIRVIKSIRMR